jgi:hypothetical protein
MSHSNEDYWIANGRKLTALAYTPHRTRLSFAQDATEPASSQL